MQEEPCGWWFTLQADLMRPVVVGVPAMRVVCTNFFRGYV